MSALIDTTFEAPLDHKTRMRLALKFLYENPQENATTATRIWGLSPRTVRNVVQMKDKLKKPLGHNKILSQEQEASIHTFIQSHIIHGFMLIRDVIFAAISHLKLKEKAHPPSQSWFTKW
jgi:hypothetical protein